MYFDQRVGIFPRGVIAMSDNFIREKAKIKLYDKDLKSTEYDVDCETGDTEGSLRLKVLYAQLDARLKKIEEVLGIK